MTGPYLLDHPKMQKRPKWMLRQLLASQKPAAVKVLTFKTLVFGWMLESIKDGHTFFNLNSC